MMAGFGARLAIQGQYIRPVWDGRNSVALDGLSIVWGRDDAYDETAPGTLSASVIDPTGEWIGADTLGGQVITVTRTHDTLPNMVVFRGRITAARPERRVVYNPATKTYAPVWIVTISAGDKLADAASTVIPGEMGQKSIEGPGGWGEQYTDTRMANLFSFGAKRIFDSYEGVAPEATADGQVLRRMHGQSASDQRSVLDLIAQVYRLVPLGVVNYNPDTNRVQVGGFATASSIVLDFDGDTIRITVPSGRLVPASRVAVPEGLVGETTASDAIDVVQIAYNWYGKDPNMTPGTQKRVIYTGALYQRNTARGAISDSNRVLKIDTQSQFRDPDEFEPGPGPVQYGNAFPQWLANRITEIVNKLNGQMRLPKLRLDDRRLPLTQGTSDALYRPYQTDAPLYFLGSVFNSLENAGPEYQAIGGTLRYKGGWMHDLTVIPARSNRTSNLTLADLFGQFSNGRLRDFDPDIRLSDFTNVTKGL
jgi:hypothetical protein